MITVTATLDGVSTKKQIAVIYKQEGQSLTPSDIAQLNDDKVVMVQVHTIHGVSQGSGVIIAENGLILTNEHVVEGMLNGTITLNNGQVYELEGIVEADELKDLALIKTKEKLAVAPVSIGSYTRLAKGEQIVAIGSPLGLQNTVSTGVVSSLREFDGIQHIQISVPIDHGSSGGGLFNNKGELVGITTWGVADNTADLNFAVAIDEIENWKHYFTMPFESITVKDGRSAPLPPLSETIQIPGLHYIAIGMTKEQVKQAEPAWLLQEDSTSLMYTGNTIFSLPASVTYVFENNQLRSIYIFHDLILEEEYLGFDVLEAYFSIMYNDLSTIYGSPVFLDTEWYDDTDGFSLNAFWLVGSSQDILLTTQVNWDYTSIGGIVITIQ